MNAIRKILVIIDLADADHPALLKGALLAEKFEAKLELFACNAEPHPGTRVASRPEQNRVALATQLADQIESLAMPLRARGLDVTTGASYATASHAPLLDRVRRMDAELIVKDTHHRTFARRTVFTNTDWELIRGAPASLLLTKPTAWSTLPSILAAVDLEHKHEKVGSLDSSLLDWVVGIAQYLDGKVHVMHAYPPRVAAVAPMMTGALWAACSSPVVTAAEHAYKFEALADLATRYSLPRANIHLEIGGIRDSICRVASDVRADIVAMETLSCSGLTRAFIGNTAEEILQHSPCDALVVKS